MMAPSPLHPSADVRESEARVSPEHAPQPETLRRAAERALELGRSVAGTTGPNPPVGCVIVAGDRIVGEGATRPAGGPHAEVVALGDAGELARGATAVVTLEPCGHTGRTGPCSTALLEAGLVVTPGRAFGAGGDGWVRLALVPDVSGCREVMRRWSDAHRQGLLPA